MKIVLMMMPVDAHDGRVLRPALAVDYDSTISLNPEAFRRHLPPLAKELHLDLIVATSRRGSHADREEFKRVGLGEWTDDIVCCGRNYKIDACRAMGYDVRIWIDDEPESAKRGGVWWAKISGAVKWLRQHFQRKG